MKARAVPLAIVGRIARPAPARGERALRRIEVEALLGISRQAFDRLRHRPDFPPARRWMLRSPRWLEAEILGWLAGTPTDRPPVPSSWPTTPHTPRRRNA